MRRNMKAGFTKAQEFTGMYGSINTIMYTLLKMALLFIQMFPVIQATVNIETPVQNQNLQLPIVRSIQLLTDRDGKIFGQTNEQTLSLNINQTKLIKQKIMCYTIQGYGL